ncbi:MAG TPA: c-type cytochrome [Isosphaeraceae bacterium]|jgi:cbb3-type cytochrome oxidase cytochrome c subunit|nr:c-type cytochrome [Isosphaeraceae bacterium]
MPATEETYRSTPTLHVVFAISSIAMLLSVVWMIMADHLRPWKVVQREFHKVEDAKLAAAEQKKFDDLEARHQADLKKLDEQIAAAKELEEKNYREIREKEVDRDKLTGKFDSLDNAKRFKKVELDSLRSFYDGAIDRNEMAEAALLLETQIIPSEAQYEKITKEHEATQVKLRKVTAEVAQLKGNIDDLIKQKENLTREYDTAKRVREQKEAQYGEGGLGSKFAAWFRGLPLLDMMASPVRIQQISLPELTINYNFKEVPRYDRCTTCHQGIDRLGYDKDASGEPMPKVFASHPHLAEGATAIDPTGKVVTAGLYLDGNGPHKINSFGCTICHGGQGSGTDFTFASHEPNDVKEKTRWEKDYEWHNIHFWDEPMLPKRFVQSSCLKCHYQVTDVPQADKLLAGYKRIVKYGCTGCHQIGGEGVMGPDLSDARKVGPNLAHIASKTSQEWTLKWIKNPHAFRPDTRMPRFYGLVNNDSASDWPKNHAEIHSIVHYLWAKSQTPGEFVDPPAKGEVAHGKDLFFQKGCMACHSHKTFDPSTIPDRAGLGVSAREFADADFGPNLSNIAAKFQSNEQGYKWLANWIHAPETYHSQSLMPNLQLSWQDAADIASWILTVPGEWATPLEMPGVNDPEVREGLDELVANYKRKTDPISQVPDIVKGMSQDQKLMFLGEKTIGRLGCFGCHEIPGFEKYKPIGTPLGDWGIKGAAKLDFSHINEFLEEREDPVVDEYYREKIDEHTRTGFLFEKLHRPRSYDYRKTKKDLKAWDDRLRMPQFAWANDPKAIEEVMTFVLGLTNTKIGSKYLPHYRPDKAAIAQGDRLLIRYNCAGCHTLSMPKYTIAADTKLEDAMPDFTTNVSVSYGNRANDFLELYPGLPYDPKKKPELKESDGKDVTIEGMPVAIDENILSVQLWKPATIRGFTFSIGDNVALDRNKVKIAPPEGGNFAWLYATERSERSGEDFASVWNRLPPPLIREGLKVQTPWLTGFLKDPAPIRPAVNLRMPRFHFAQIDNETRDLANYFPARDGAQFPYQSIPERDQEYLTKLEAEHPSYLSAGWNTITKGACIQCHAIGQYKPTGGAQVVNGPDLRVVNNRFQPGYLTQWLARPNRLLPYTAMPQNIPPQGPPPQFVPKTFEDKRLAQVKAMRDTLLNYVTAVEQQLAGAKAATDTAKPGAE